MLQVLVIFLGEAFSLWQSPLEILPYKKYEAEKEQQASELAHLHQLRRASQFRIGLQVECLMR